VIGTTLKERSVRILQAKRSKGIWANQEGANYIFRGLQLPIQILERAAEIVFLFNGQRSVSEPVDSSSAVPIQRLT
jgi:hypothetical protein